MFESAVARRLVERVTGPVLGPDDDGYAAEVAGFNRIVEHSPAIAVGVRDALEVREVIDFAAEAVIPVAVQGTGHGPSTAAEGTGLLLNTRRMTDVSIDPGARIARAGAGAQWRHVIEAAAAHGLAPLNGSSPLVGVVGYTLGGGLALMSRKYGFAADHVTAIEVVTADARLRIATAEQNEDLFWALRGGKGNFGVVTAIEFGLVPVTQIYGGGLFFPGEAAADVLHGWRSWVETVPDEMSSSLALMRMPDMEPIPEFLRGRLVAHVRVLHLGPADEGERLVKPLREVADAMVDTLAEMPYTRCAEIHNDPTFPIPYHERSVMLRELGDDAAAELLALAGPESGCVDLAVELRHMGGALTRPPAVPNAVDHRDAAFCLSTLALPGPGARPAQVVEGMAAWTTGRRYLNFCAGAEMGALAEEGYGADTYARLRDIKTQYDPDNLFRFNHNIPPRTDA
ncbi:bagremycin/ferroverdin biosynthesis FAD-dependent oxygenase BagK/FevA1 [Streptomyces silvensis]|uniref:FAD-binding PCMH-type domain-containing protein n=1 Tax=Streptomyces silvensis TaxID=1765722 RepID=A0A0W7WY37_9ACTN|nr:bagremycin/ferroverdin biosynthesis FAD-dependent oxygenase BagK/FevA1 [Streptomyces silvensis]KUF15500.1 hypothetical protein AT728_25945 [Streptomyces silvensis]